MSFLNSMKLKWKLALMLLIPALVIGFFAFDKLQTTTGLLKETDKISLLSELSVKTSALVHELQKERGISAGYLGSGGEQFKVELPKQRTLTDLKASELTSFLQKTDADFSASFKSTANTALKELSTLDGMRNHITQQNIPTKSAIVFYTDMNARFIDLIKELPKLSSLGDINNAATAYVNFILSKERAGVERAVLASTFSADQFAPGVYDKIVLLIAEQDTYFSVFKSLATSEQLKAFNALHNENVFQQTTQMRDIAIKNATSGNFNVDPKVWFNAQTDKINLLKAFEDQLSVELLKQADSIHDSAETSLYLTIATVIFSIVAVFIIGLVVVRKILSQLGSDPAELQTLTEEIANGNLEINFDHDRKKSVGVMASMHTMRDKLYAQRKSDRIMTAENKRFVQALETIDTHIMIADQDYNIIYINPSLKEFLGNAENNFRKDLPNFNLNKLIGSNMDIFHKNPAHQRAMIEKLTSTVKVDLTIGGVHVSLKASPVFDENGERQGTVVEWVDRYQEVVIQEEMSSIISDALNGDLSRRINLENKKSFFKDLSKGINQLMNVFDQVITDTATALGSMAQGNLTQKIESDYEGSFGQLKNDVNTTIDKLTEVMSEISNSATSVLSSSQEIAQGNVDLSQRTEQQASSLEETASSMEEMTSTVRQNADNARQANQLASGTREQAEQGGKVVNQAVTAMTGITESSNKIAAIIGVIDEIAFQTNLLALNAAVEAARAGEQGRGFAVVASEVRNLAGRSATAAKEIKGLIEDSVVKVEQGSKLVDASGQTLDEIMTSVKKVSDIIAEIAAASLEQSDGIEQVNKAIAQMDEMTQQNAALVEEAAAASESMGEQAGNLNEMVGFFKTGNSVKTYSGTERRKSERPWAEKPTTATTSMKPANQIRTAKAAGNVADSNEWEEF